MNSFHEEFKDYMLAEAKSEVRQLECRADFFDSSVRDLDSKPDFMKQSTPIFPNKHFFPNEHSKVWDLLESPNFEGVKHAPAKVSFLFIPRYQFHTLGVSTLDDFRLLFLKLQHFYPL